MELKDIQNFIKFVSRSGVSEIKLETKDLKLTVRTPHRDTATDGVFSVPQQVMSMPGQPPIQGSNIFQPVTMENVSHDGSSESNKDENDKYITIKSPMIGTFYRRPSPDKDPFVEIGAFISNGSVLCVIEAMKLFNEIESDVSGKVVKVLVDDKSPVEFDQPLFLVDPS